MSFDQQTLSRLHKRRHPEYDANKEHWDFLEACYRGGREWFGPNIFRYHKEGENEFRERVERAYRFNHTREVVDLVNKYIFRAKPHRRDDAPQSVKDFWANATREGQSIDEHIRGVSQGASTFGRTWVVVDRIGGGGVSQAEEKEQGARTYSYTVDPQHMLDMSFDDAGELNWAFIRELHRDDENPFESSGAVSYRYRLWTRNEWYLFKEVRKGRQVFLELIDSNEHGLGVVPVLYADHIHSDSLYTAPSLIGDIAYQDRAVANYLSNLDAIIQDQTFSQLAMPAQNLMPGEDSYKKLVELGTKRIFLYDGEGGGQPFFLSPDPKQAELIITAIRQIINEIYHTVGMAGERTKQDNAAGIDNSSGVAKAYDFERVNALLTSKAASLERVEEKIAELVQRWAGETPVDTKLVSYPDNFDVRGLADEFEIASQLSLVQAPAIIRREQMKAVREKLFPRASDSERKRMDREIDKWLLEEPLPLPSAGAISRGAGAGKPTDETATQDDMAK